MKIGFNNLIDWLFVNYTTKSKDTSSGEDIYLFKGKGVDDCYSIYFKQGKGFKIGFIFDYMVNNKKGFITLETENNFNFDLDAFIDLFANSIECELYDLVDNRADYLYDMKVVSYLRGFREFANDIQRYSLNKKITMEMSRVYND